MPSIAHGISGVSHFLSKAGCTRKGRLVHRHDQRRASTGIPGTAAHIAFAPGFYKSLVWRNMGIIRVSHICHETCQVAWAGCFGRRKCGCTGSDFRKGTAGRGHVARQRVNMGLPVQLICLSFSKKSHREFWPVAVPS